MTSPIAIHKPELCRFEIQDLGDKAMLDYEIQGSQVLFTHTFVAPEKRGQGLADILAAAALAWAKEEKLHAVPVCSFVQRWMQAHPEARGL